MPENEPTTPALPQDDAAPGAAVPRRVIVEDRRARLAPIRAEVEAMMAAPDWPERAKQLIAEIREKQRTKKRRRRR